MAIRITLECGHASQLRARTTPEGYTHDWEVFVRGVDNADIQHYVEKVVFYLHETFPKPKRVLKEPPFAVKESGYAGFMIPIHIFLKNKDEPKMFTILYDLSLQQSGPAINKVVQHSEIIGNPSDEFRRKLLRGGATALSGTEDLQEKNETKMPPMVGKPKLSGSESKKHRLTEPKTSNSFADLFGPPIKTAKISPDSKKVVQSEKSSVHKAIIPGERVEKLDKSARSRETVPPRDLKREKTEDKREKRSKDQSKEKVKIKEKSKRSSSPSVNKQSSSPANGKRLPSPSQHPPAKRSSSPKAKPRDPKNSSLEKDRDRDREREKERDKEKDREKEKEKEREKEKEKDKEREKEKGREKEKEKEKGRDSTNRIVLDVTKSERKKEKKKHKEERDKERKEKGRDGERMNAKDTAKSNERKGEKLDKPEKSDKEKCQEYKQQSKDDKRSPKVTKDIDSKGKEEKSTKGEKSERGEKPERAKDGKGEKDRQKHKHKKRDKKERRDGSKDRERKEKREKSKNIGERQNADQTAYPTSGTPLSTLLSEVPESRDSSDSAPSVDEDSFPESQIKPVPAKKDQDEEFVETKISLRKEPPTTSGGLNSIGIDGQQSPASLTSAATTSAGTSATSTTTTATTTTTTTATATTTTTTTSMATTTGTSTATASSATTAAPHVASAAAAAAATALATLMGSTTTTATMPMTATTPMSIGAATMATSASATMTAAVNTGLALTTSSPTTSTTETKREKAERSKRERTKGLKSEDRESRKRKRRGDGKPEEEQHVTMKRDRERERERTRERENIGGCSVSPSLLEPVSSSQSPVSVAASAVAAAAAAAAGATSLDSTEPVNRSNDKTDRRLPVCSGRLETDAEQVAPDSTNNALMESEAIHAEPPVFSEDYVSQLKELQQKIMTLQDNQELERVVQVIVETGQYEITKKTFDFDLCALDRRTVQRLQQFFSAS